MNTKRGDGATTVVASEVALLSAFKSPSATTATAWFTLGAALPFTATVSVYRDESFAARTVAVVHVTIWPDAEHVQPEPVPETNVNPTGSESVTAIVPPVAARPTFLTVTA